MKKAGIMMLWSECFKRVWDRQLPQNNIDVDFYVTRARTMTKSSLGDFNR